MEFDREFMETVQLGALLHDIGKIGIKDSILNKPAKLTDEEFEIMKTHVMIGANIVKPVSGLSKLADGILYHHERWDGRGYPMGLKGENIPIAGRIVHVADSYDTITTARAYKLAQTPDEAFEELIRCAGSQFDPQIVELFFKAYKSGRLSKREYLSFDFSRLR